TDENVQEVKEIVLKNRQITIREIADDLNMERKFMDSVSSKNPYLFDFPTIKKDKNRYLSVCDLLRQYAVQCDAENPETLRATELRKHVATMCIHHNLSENEILTLAKFMGHHDKIHLTYYRQPVIEKEIFEVSKYLEAAQGESDSDYESSENITTTTMETYNDETEKKIASRKKIQDLQQSNLFCYK
ncbi:hypothetical protein ALC57_13318, partial [Trachymyrmex cornetzi]